MLLLLANCTAFSSEQEPTNDRLSDDGLRVRGVFDSNLPGTERKHSLKLILHPHLADLYRYDHFRTALGLNYAVSRRLELRVESESYFSHGLGHARFLSEAGLGEFHGEVKYRIGKTLFSRWDTAVGLGYRTPIGTPPADVTDGLVHRTVYATFARPLESRPDIRIFWGIAGDLVSETSIQGRHDKNRLRANNQTLSAGLVVDRGAVHYTLEAKATTARLLSGVNEDVFELRPGFVWQLPRGERFNRRGKWVLGVALSTEYGPDGFDIGIGARLRVDLDLKALIGRRR